MIAWFARNGVAANLLMISILAAGLFSLKSNILLEVFPSIEIDVISVNISLRGATPEDVEKSVTIRVEEAVQDLEGIDKISSKSSEGASSVSIEISDSYDTQTLLAEVKSRVDAINTFPSDADRPIISISQRIREVITVTLSSEYGEKETREYAQTLRDEMLRIPGITQLVLDGVRDFEMTIEVPQDKLLQYGLTLETIAQAIQQTSLDVSSGNLRTSGGDILLRSTGQAYNKDEFASILVKTNEDGSVVRLDEVATIIDGFEETPIRTRFNGKNAVFIEVYRIGDQNAIEVAEKIRAFIKDKNPSLPQGYELSAWDDDSQIIKSRIATLSNSAIQGSILVLALLTLFLRPAIAFWVFIGIPVSFMGAFLFMPVFDVTLNVLSLFAFILVLGIVVDDAIVTGESIYTHLNKKNVSSEEAVIRGTQEVSVPVTFGILTTIAAFMPLMFVEGQRSAMFTQIPLIIVPVLIFSLIESKFVLPSHLKHIKLRHEKGEIGWFEKYQQKFADGFERSILKYYRPVLHLALRHKLTTLFSFFSVLAIMVAFIMSGWMQFTFFPRVPSETIRVTLVMPTGTPFEITNQHVLTIAANAEKLRQKYIDEATNESIIKNVLAVTGGGGESAVGKVRFEITPPEQRELKISSQALATEWRKMNGDLAGAEALAYRAEIGRGGSPIDVQVSGASLKELGEISEKVKKHLAQYPTVFDITDTLSDGKEELRIDLTNQGRAVGLTRSDVAGQIKNAYFGSEAQRIQRGRDDVRVMVRLPLDERRSISNLQSLLIKTPSGGEVPLVHVATLKASKGPSEIKRVDRFRTVNVTGDVEKNNTNMTVVTASLREFMDQLVAQYPSVSYVLEGEAKEQSESFGSLFWSLLAVLFVIYVLLAIPFKSYLQPLVVMSVIPFGVIGAVLGHLIMGSTLTLLSLMGMLALTGVVVNDSLVLVDYINKKRTETNDLMEAILTAGAARFRPVLLTSLTTFIGLMPLLFEEATQAQFLIPMAISLGFGILFATVITLIMVPTNYLLLEGSLNFFNKLFQEKLTKPLKLKKKTVPQTDG